MRLSKITHHKHATFIVLRGEDESDYCTITLAGHYRVEMPNAHALTITPGVGDNQETTP